MLQSKYITIKTKEGTTLRLYKEKDKKPILHSSNGPAIKYPKSLKKQNEYYVYGIKYTKGRWLEIKESSKIDSMLTDVKLENS